MDMIRYIAIFGLTIMFGLIQIIIYPAAHAESPGEIEVVYTGDSWTLAEGGLDVGTTYLDNIDVSLAADLEAVFGWKGASLFAYGFTNNGDSFSEDRVGDLQVVSNIDNHRVWRLFEIWVEQQFANDAASIKLGVIDLNTEFDSIDSAGLFLNSSHGIGPDFSQSGENGPSIFPTTSIAGRAYFQSEYVNIRFGVFDAVPGNPDKPRKNVFKVGDGHGVLMVSEVNITPSENTRIGAGYWRYTSEFEELLNVDPNGAARRRDGNDGAYAFIDQRLYSRPDDADRGLNGYLRFGHADDGINPIGAYIGGGLVYNGLLQASPPDSIGFAVASAQTSKDFRAAGALSGTPIERREVNLELTYRIEMRPWLALQPDIQYIFNPGADPTLDNAVVVGLRFEFGRVFSAN